MKFYKVVSTQHNSSIDRYPDNITCSIYDEHDNIVNPVELIWNKHPKIPLISYIHNTYNSYNINYTHPKSTSSYIYGLQNIKDWLEENYNESVISIFYETGLQNETSINLLFHSVDIYVAFKLWYDKEDHKMSFIEMLEFPWI